MRFAAWQGLAQKLRGLGTAGKLSTEKNGAARTAPRSVSFPSVSASHLSTQVRFHSGKHKQDKEKIFTNTSLLLV
jgi:hypothetical protein